MMRESQREVTAGNRMLWSMWVVLFDVMSVLLRASGIFVIQCAAWSGVVVKTVVLK
jgi:hypothetical protein